MVADFICITNSSFRIIFGICVYMLGLTHPAIVQISSFLQERPMDVELFNTTEQRRERLQCVMSDILGMCDCESDALITSMEDCKLLWYF